MARDENYSSASDRASFIDVCHYSLVCDLPAFVLRTALPFRKKTEVASN